jgi:tRNA (uracil-5-)-methyltransferase TRM9
MDAHIQSKLLEINREFYTRFSHSFSTTRHQVQPGVHQLIHAMLPAANILDVGCGNGTLARALVAQGFSGEYLGVDLSSGLLAQAETLLNKPKVGSFNFQLIDLAEPEWHASIPYRDYTWLTAFAILHHLPGEALRQQTARAMRKLIASDGCVAVSVWQWHNSPQLQKRVLPWSTVGLAEDDLDQGDVLLDWRADESVGLRYVHTFSEESLTALAQQAGFRVSESLYSDGKSGNLALYQVWKLEFA